MRRLVPRHLPLGLATCLVLVFVAACSDSSIPTGIDDVWIQASAAAESDPGTDTDGVGPSEVTLGSIIPVVSEGGFVTLSVDGAGTNAASSIIQVDKPAGATVRGAYFAAASTGFSNRVLANGDVKIDGVGVTWSINTPSSISSSNHWADVTSMVKGKIDAAPAGLVSFTITEVSTFGIDGEILAVIFDDPAATTSNTIVLLFGAQAIAGDDFFVNLANPLDLSEPGLILDMGLGISFGHQPGGQVSLVDVNGARLTSCAGGEDDGVVANGALLTVGGVGDSNTNPAPFCSGSSGPLVDDELYDLKPFTETGDTDIAVHTVNPSNDDNIFFASFFLTVDATVTPEPDPNNSPVADAGPDQSLDRTSADGVDVTLDGSGSTDADGDDIIVSYEWFDEDDNLIASGINPVVEDLGLGIHTIRLVVTDDQGATSEDLVEIEVLNVPPDADAGADQSGLDAVECSDDGSGTSVSLDGSGSSDLDGVIVSWEWFDEDDNLIAEGETTTASFGLGTHTVTLVVTDNDGATDTDDVDIEIVDTTAPSLVVSASPESLSPTICRWWERLITRWAGLLTRWWPALTRRATCCFPAIWEAPEAMKGIPSTPIWRGISTWRESRGRTTSRKIPASLDPREILSLTLSCSN